MVALRRLPLLLLAAVACAIAAPAAAVTQNATVSANVVRPLTLVSQQNLDLGTITLSLGTWSAATVGISRAGVFSCSAKVTCTGAPQVAKYKVTGSNKMVVKITAPDVTMVNQADPTQTLTLAVDNPGQVTLTSSGEPGVTFGIGGSVTLSSTTPTGNYSGTFNVTVDYQ
jgi:hypothetical protein